MGNMRNSAGVRFVTVFTIEQQPVKSPLHRLTRAAYNFECPNTFRGPAGDPR